MASFSTSKLDNIIKSIDLNASECGRLVSVVQERLQRGEREDAAEERRSAGIAREEQSAFIKQQQEERKLQTKRMIVTPLCSIKKYKDLLYVQALEDKTCVNGFEDAQIH